MNPALDYARGRRALRPLLRSLTFVAELIAKPFRKAADFCDSPGPCNPRLGSVLQIAGVSRQSLIPATQGYIPGCGFGILNLLAMMQRPPSLTIRS
jgi:hypothetical protein